MTPEIAVERLVKIVRRVAWSPHSGLSMTARSALRQAITGYETASSRPTVYDHLLSEDPFEGSPSPTGGVICKHCKNPFKPRKKGQKFCNSSCRVQNWKLRQSIAKAKTK
jgi:hypothetical protein